MGQQQNIQTYIDNKETKRAEIAIAKALRQAPHDQARQPLLLQRAQVRMLTARPDDALTDLNLAGIDPKARGKSPEHLELLADAHLSRFELSTVGFAERRDVHTARDLYRHLLDAEPDYPNRGWLLYQLGRIALILDQAPAAERHFHSALFSPSPVAALTAYCYERLGFIAYYESRQPKTARVLLDKAIQTYPADAATEWLVQVHLLRSRVLKATDPAEARDAAQAALEIATPQKTALPEALFTMAEILTNSSDHAAEIIDHLQHFFQISKMPLGVDVTWSRAYEMLGDAYYAIARYENAIAAYQNALQFNPYHPWAESLYYRMAQAHYQSHDYRQAIQTLDDYLANETVDYHPVYMLLGNAHFALSQYAQAANAYQKALIHAANTQDTHYIQHYLAQAQEHI